MASYSVKQVAEMLHTNPETVRRWIRAGKLESVQESKKEGNVISEEALKAFLRGAPKYAAVVATMVGAGVLPLLPAMGLPVGLVTGIAVGASQKRVLSEQDAKRIFFQTRENYTEELDRKQAELKRELAQKQAELKKLEDEIKENERQIRAMKKFLSKLEADMFTK